MHIKEGDGWLFANFLLVKQRLQEVKENAECVFVLLILARFKGGESVELVVEGCLRPVVDAPVLDAVPELFGLYHVVHFSFELKLPGMFPFQFGLASLQGKGQLHQFAFRHPGKYPLLDGLPDLHFSEYKNGLCAQVWEQQYN